MQSLDALRVMATFFVILLHVSIAYLPHGLVGLLWVVRDPQPGHTISIIFWFVESTAMPLFFLIAGFCAGLMSLKMSAGEFLKHRQKRLLTPLLLGCVLILPLSFAVWTLGLVGSGELPIECVRAFAYPQPINGQIRGLSHLWFLQYLLLYSIGFGGFLFWKQRKAQKIQNNMKSSFSERLFRSRWMLPIMFIPSCVVLWYRPEVVTGFQHGFLPFPAKFTYTIPFFVAGIALSCMRPQLDSVLRYRNRYLLLAVCSFPLMLMLIEKHITNGTIAWERIGLVVSISFFAWMAVLGLFGFFMNLEFPASKRIAYLADASFWVYLIHHPFVGLSQMRLAGTSLNGGSKFVLTTVIATGLSLGTYHVFIRQRRIGFLLGEKPFVKDAASSKPVVGRGLPHPADLNPQEKRAA